MQNSQKGFTLIELMIVVAIVAILAAIALPAYQNYTKRAKVSESIVAMDACRTSVTEFLASQGTLPTDTSSAGCSAHSTQYMSALTVSSGTIMATTTNISSDVNGQTVQLAPTVSSGANTDGSTDSSLQVTAWTCSSTISNKSALPATCRGTATQTTP